MLNSLWGGETPDEMFDDGVLWLACGSTFMLTAPGRLAGYSYYGWSSHDGAWGASNYFDHMGLIRDGDDVNLYFHMFEHKRGAEPEHEDRWRNFWIHPRITLAPYTPYAFMVYQPRGRFGAWRNRLATGSWAHDNLLVPTFEGTNGGRYLYSPDVGNASTHSPDGYAVDILVETD